MPYSAFIAPHRRLTVVRFTDVYTTQDGHDWAKRYVTDPAFARDQIQIIDLSGVSRFEADFNAVASLVSRKAELFADIVPGTLCVLIAPTGLAYGMARMYQQLGADRLPFDMHVVSTEAEAFLLADLEDTTLDALEAEADHRLPERRKSY